MRSLLYVIAITSLFSCSLADKSFRYDHDDAVKLTNKNSSELASKLRVTYIDSKLHTATQDERNAIAQLALIAERKTRALLPKLTDEIEVKVNFVDRDIEQYGGVSGRAENPKLVLLEVSTKYTGGINAAIEAGVLGTLMHEFHHLDRGWTMHGNRFGPGIAIASVNEGLATVFAETYKEGNAHILSYPNEIKTWVEEILNLPADAPYGPWRMEKRVDGRDSIGYRAGKYIVLQAINKSGKSILELSNYSPYEILEFSGLIDNHSISLSKLGDYYAGAKLKNAAIDSYQRAYDIAKNISSDEANGYLNKIYLLNNPIVFSDAELSLYSGSYRSDRMSFMVRKQGLELTVQMPGRPPFKLIPNSKNKFVIPSAGVMFDFNITTKGKVDFLSFHVNGQKFRVPKES